MSYSISTHLGTHSLSNKRTNSNFISMLNALKSSMIDLCLGARVSTSLSNVLPVMIKIPLGHTPPITSLLRLIECRQCHHIRITKQLGLRTINITIMIPSEDDLQLVIALSKMVARTFEKRLLTDTLSSGSPPLIDLKKMPLSPLTDH